MTPCYKCEDRQMLCHASCERYAQFVKENDDRRIKMNAALNSKSFLIDEYHKNAKRLRLHRRK